MVDMSVAINLQANLGHNALTHRCKVHECTTDTNRAHQDVANHYTMDKLTIYK